MQLGCIYIKLPSEANQPKTMPVSFPGASFASNPSVTLHLLLLLTVPRDYFLIAENYKGVRSMLVERFGELMRKIWNPRNFKGQVGDRGQRGLPISAQVLLVRNVPY
jgi:hypothetical protein